MRLRGLRINGFKSFADTTEIRFHGGVTAIVGPNGCGKSNIGDAIRWVLGEQRPTAIRSAKMEDVIFQGSVGRQPVNRSAVHLLVTNEDGLLPVPFEEVEIGRIVYRDGGSDYSINRTLCRLRDVVDLCRDTGLGANAYRLIENKMIDVILSERAEERRGLFEEAAGIGKYKDRRKAAQRRLERAELDLKRLEDVIAEVRTKVRSLARQKGRAERYLSLRTRRLNVEITVVTGELEELNGRLVEIEKELAGGALAGQGTVGELRAAEVALESLRACQLDAERARSAAAEQLDRVRGRLTTWERDLAVTDERAVYAERRMEVIGEERAQAQADTERLGEQARGLSTEASRFERMLGEAQALLAERRRRAEEVRRDLARAREAVETTGSREREVSRRGAQLAADALASDAQAGEQGRRVERLMAELDEVGLQLDDLKSQGDLFADRREQLAGRVRTGGESVVAALRARDLARAVAEEARGRELATASRTSALSAQLDALEAMESDREGLEPVVRAALARGEGDVLGVLVDFVRVPDGLAAAVETYLGPLARALVVRDVTAAERMRAWFHDEWGEGGALLLLPLGTAPERRTGTLFSAIEAVGAGAPWVRALLGGVDLVEDGVLLQGDGPRLSRSGWVRDPQGVVRIGKPSSSSGALERRERLGSLTTEADRARAEADAAHAALTDAQAAASAAEEELELERERQRAVEDELRRADAEVAVQSDREARMQRLRDELARQIEVARDTRARAEEHFAKAQEDCSALELEEARLKEGRAEARRSLEEAQEEWEGTRAEESAQAVEETRLEGEVRRVRERLNAVGAARAAAHARLKSLEREERSLAEELTGVGRLREEGARATERLFRERDEAEAELGQRDRLLQDVATDITAAERRVRAARQAERETSDRLHALELARQEVSAGLDRIRDRLETEWGRSLEHLTDEAEPVDGDLETLEAELREIVVAIERLEPVNMLAVEEHEEESGRLGFLSEQCDDLKVACDDLRSAIRHINVTANKLFTETFEQIRENFRIVHRRLFEGGEADIRLAQGEDLLEAPIEIHASPGGKKTQRIDQLSGGERALTALSLLFAIYLVKPSPFCVLDEVDAPLDENNIGRFVRLLDEFKKDTQFVVITHNPSTIEAADWIYGVTMEEPGVSHIVGVRLEDALKKARGTAA